MLTRRQIIEEQNLGRIVIEPWIPKNLQPNSIDVRLAPNLSFILDKELDFKKAYEVRKVIIPEEGLVLWPTDLVLGVTVERTYSPYHIPKYEGRSTTGRYFLQSHQTAGFGDLGFNGHWTLEITVSRPIRIYPYMRIGQIGFDPAQGDIEEYTGNYSNRNHSQGYEPICGKPGNI